MLLENNNNKKWRRINHSSYFSLDFLLLFSYFPFSFLPSLSFFLFLFPLFHFCYFHFFLFRASCSMSFSYISKPLQYHLFFRFLPASHLSYLFILSIHLPFHTSRPTFPCFPVSFSSSFIFPFSSYLILLLSSPVFHWKIAKHILKQVLTFIKYSSFVSKMESSFWNRSVGNSIQGNKSVRQWIILLILIVRRCMT